MTDLRSSAKLRPLLLRLWRIAALAALALLAGWQARRADERARPASVRLEEARLLFPHAAALSPAAVDGSHAVYDAGGAALGSVLRTSPQADRRELSGQRVSHLMDARTGRPITHQTVSVSVRHADTALADAWATALNVLGREEGLPLAERLGLAAEFVEERDGELAVTATVAWRVAVGGQ